MRNKINNRISSVKINNLINNLSGPDYITYAYSEIGINSLIILRNVFRSDKSYLGNYLGKILHIKKNLIKSKKVLDLGCGCGLLGIICALNGAKEIVFSDINPVAIKNCILNTILLDIKNASFFVGDLFNNIPVGSKFDVIIFNSPTISRPPSNIPETAFLRDDKLIINFFKSFSNYLKKDGIAIMTGSTIYEENVTPINLANKYKYRYKIIHKEYENKNNYKYVIEIKNMSLF